MSSERLLKPTFREAFQFWLKLGFISFGGPAGQIAIMHTFLVEQKKWISEGRFMHALNYCMLLPGPEAQQLATYIGWLLHGVHGGLVAGLLFIFPSLFILLGLSALYVLFGKLVWVSALFYGLKPAVVAIVVLALIKIGKRSLIGPFHYAIACLSFIGIYFLDVPFPIIILVTVPVGYAFLKIKPSWFKKSLAQQYNDSQNEAAYYLNKYSPSLPKRGLKYVASVVSIGLLLWFVPFLFFSWSEQSHFWHQLTFFFTKAAFVTFGGAYAVLPYVAQVSVDEFQWLSASQMIDGLALGETTPGPLIMVLTFVGFMAGFQNGGTLLAASLGLLSTAYYTFLPSFVFILTGAPLVERSHQNEKLKIMLSVVTAAVVGVILNLTIYFGKAVVFDSPGSWHPDWFSVIWGVLSIVVLYRLKFPMVAWIGVSALAGLLSLYF